MTDSEHTTAKLARALEAIPGIPPDMIERARTGFYHDYLSPLAAPEIQLLADLRELAARPGTPRNSRPLLRVLAKAVIDGQYDASKEEADEWARSQEGQETIAEFTGAQVVIVRDMTGSHPDGDAVKACADLVGRTGAKEFECGYVHEDVPADQAGWFATAVYKGAKITEQDKASPAEACDALAERLLSGAQCQHCHGLVALTDEGAFAYRSAVLATGQRWDAADAARAPQCRWTRAGGRWERGCT
jgi:hypothetical protein